MDLTSIRRNFVVIGLATAIAAAVPAADVHAIAQAVDERYNHLQPCSPISPRSIAEPEWNGLNREHFG